MRLNYDNFVRYVDSVESSKETMEGRKGRLSILHFSFHTNPIALAAKRGRAAVVSLVRCDRNLDSCVQL